MKVERLEKTINNFLQQKISFSINGKSVKTGRLILFCIKDFYLVFTIMVNQSKKIFEVPYPYNFSTDNKKIIFDYTLDSLCNRENKVMEYAKFLVPKKTNKYFNTYAEIVIVEDHHTITK
jgi:hypothetical protein